MAQGLDFKIEDMVNYDYEIAKAGGRHKGFFQKWKEKRVEEIEKSIRSLGEQIAIHNNKIAKPDEYINKNIPLQQRENLINRYWPKEILNFEQQVNILKGILEERKP